MNLKELKEIKEKYREKIIILEEMIELEEMIAKVERYANCKYPSREDLQRKIENLKKKYNK